MEKAFSFRGALPPDPVVAPRWGQPGRAVKTCAPAVPRQLAGRWAERQQQPVDSKKSYLITNLS